MFINVVALDNIPQPCALWCRDRQTTGHRRARVATTTPARDRRAVPRGLVPPRLAAHGLLRKPSPLLGQSQRGVLREPTLEFRPCDEDPPSASNYAEFASHVLVEELLRNAEHVRCLRQLEGEARADRWVPRGL